MVDHNETKSFCDSSFEFWLSSLHLLECFFFLKNGHGLFVEKLSVNIHVENEIEEGILPLRVNDLVWKLVTSKTEGEYHNCLHEIGQILMGAKSYLERIVRSICVDAFFIGKRFGLHISNISESLN